MIASQKLFNFNTLFSNYDDFLACKTELKKEVLEDYSCRKNKTKIMIGTETIDCNIGYVLLNIIALAPYAKTGMKVTKDEIFHYDTVTQEALEEYFNHIVDVYKTTGKTDYDVARYEIYNVINEMADLSGQINIRSGPSISYLDFIRLDATDNEARKLFHPKIKPGQYSDIEKQFNQEGNKLIDYFNSHEDTDLYPFVASGTGVNKKQLVQFAGFVGLKPDINGNVIPVTIEDNFMRGLNSIESYYINSTGTRKALITNHKYVRKSGYLTRKLSLAMIDHYHDNNIKDCGTEHFVIYNVDNARKLRMIIGRHYYDLDSSNNKVSDELKTVNKTDDFLIGKKIGLRSPVTCCSDHVCATCYGRALSEINKNINTGLSAVLKLTDPLTQKLLSAKHLLSTKTDPIVWGDDFNNYLSVNMDAIYFSDVESSISFKKPSSDNYDEDEDMYAINSFEISSTTLKKPIVYTSPVTLYVNPKFLTVEKMNDDEETQITIDSKSVNEDDFVFKYQAKNNELTKSLQQILDLIESTDHLGITDYNEFVNKFADLLIENDLDYIDSIQVEMIASILIRNEETGKRLDFSKKELDSYRIDRVSKVILDGPLATSLAFERLPDQFTDLDTYMKDDESMMDYLFR